MGVFHVVVVEGEGAAARVIWSAPAPFVADGSRAAVTRAMTLAAREVLNAPLDAKLKTRWRAWVTSYTGQPI